MIKEAVAYIRVSTEGQVGENRYGLEAQREEILKYSKEKGYNIVRWYIDGGISGVEEDREELNKILYGDDVGNPPITTVIVSKTDRLARDINLYFYYKFLLKKKNIELVSVSESFGEMGPFAAVLQSLTLFIAEQERINIAKRTSSGRRVKARAGGYSGGRVPYGYKAEDGVLVINESEAGIVRKVFTMRRQGFTMQDIADSLNDEGFLTRIGKRFYPSQVKSMLDNQKTYEGYYKYGEEMDWVRGVHEAILDEEA